MDFLDCVWLLKIGEGEIGGGICINREGWVLTSAQFLHRCGIGESIEGRTEREVMRPLRVLAKNPSLHLAMVEVHRRRSDEVFSFVDVENMIHSSFDRGDALNAIVHLDLTPYAMKSGRVCFPLPQEAYQVTWGRRDTVHDRVERNQMSDRELVIVKPFLWRTVGHVIDTDEFYDDNKYVAKNVHPDLPILQVQSLGWGKGIIGCPVFRSEAPNNFVGLMAFSKDCFEFIIPSFVACEYIKEVKADFEQKKGVKRKGKELLSSTQPKFSKGGQGKQRQGKQIQLKGGPRIGGGKHKFLNCKSTWSAVDGEKSSYSETFLYKSLSDPLQSLGISFTTMINLKELRPIETHSENQAIQNAVTKLFLKSYYGIVMKNVQNSVPEAIMLFLCKSDCEPETNMELKTPVNTSHPNFVRGKAVKAASEHIESSSSVSIIKLKVHLASQDGEDEDADRLHASEKTIKFQAIHPRDTNEYIAEQSTWYAVGGEKCSHSGRATNTSWGNFTDSHSSSEETVLYKTLSEPLETLGIFFPMIHLKESPAFLRLIETHSENQAIKNSFTKLLFVAKNVRNSVPEAITHFLHKFDSEHEANMGLKTQVLSRLEGFVSRNDQILLQGATIGPEKLMKQHGIETTCKTSVCVTSAGL